MAFAERCDLPACLFVALYPEPLTNNYNKTLPKTDRSELRAKERAESESTVLILFFYSFE